MAGLSPSKRRSMWKYYSWLAETSSDQYDKPWLSPVSAPECLGAGTLVGVMDVGHETVIEHQGRNRGGEWPTPVSFVPAMGHLFTPDATCRHCDLSWEEHQRLKSRCDKYIEPANAPREDPSIQRERVSRFKQLWWM